MSLRIVVGSRKGASPAVVVVAIVLAVMLAFVVLGSRGDDPPTPEAPQVAANPITDAQAKAAQVDAELRRAAAMSMEDVGYGTIAPPKPVDRSIVWRLQSLVAGAESLVRRGRSEALRIPEADVDAGLRTQQARANTTAWNTWLRSWEQRVEAYARELSHVSIEFDSPAYMVYQDLSFMVDDLRKMSMNYATTTNIPLRSERTSKFDAAEYRLAEASERLNNLR